LPAAVEVAETEEAAEVLEAIEQALLHLLLVQHIQ
jgi:hypothetical protein